MQIIAIKLNTYLIYVCLRLNLNVENLINNSSKIEDPGSNNKNKIITIRWLGLMEYWIPSILIQSILHFRNMNVLKNQTFRNSWIE